MKGKVNCTCGWSWNKSDSSKKDMYVCHECGRDNSNNMKNGGWLDNIPQAQDGDTTSRYNIDVRRTNMIDYVPYYENVPSPEFDDKSVERAQQSAEAYNADVLRRYGPQNEYRTAKSAQKAAERLKQLKQTVEVTPIVNNKEEEKKLEKKLENDNDIEEKSSKSKKYNNKKPKRKKEKEDDNDNDDSDGEAFIPPFILNAPNYTGVKPQFYDNVNNESKDNDGIVNLDTSAPSEVSYRDDININSANYRNAQRLAGSNLGLQLLLNDKKYKKDDDVLKKETSENEYNKSLSQEENKNVLNLNRSVNSNMFNRKLKNGGWLDSYADGGSMQEHQENYNDYKVSAHEGMVGDGFSNVGRNYSPAWGGQFKMGGSVYPVNYVPKAQDGFTSFMSNLGDNIVEFFSDEKEEKIKPIKKTSVKKSGNKDNTKTLNIVDPRKKLATTNQPLRPNSDLVGGKYSSKHLDRLIQEAKRQGMSKQDIMNLSAMGFQETKWGKTDGNIGHVMGDWGGDDDYQLFINAYNAKMKEADRLGITDPAMRLQVYNGLGTITPSTEKDYHGFEMQKIYGVPIPKGGISMKKNPLYGKQVMDIRDNVLAKNPEYIKYMDSIYKAPVPNAKYNIVPGPKMHQKSKIEKEKLAPLKKKAMGGSIPGAVGFSYARTKGIPSEGPYAKKTMPSAQNGQEMKYYQEGLDWRPKTISKNGSVIKDDMGQWAHPGEITEINSPYITMKGVPYPVLGISDTGDTQMMYPEEEYEFDGTKVTEFPMAKNGLRQEQKGLVNLDNLLNFTNYNTKQPGGWMDKYQ
jgi:hypothetical protein